MNDHLPIHHVNNGRRQEPSYQRHHTVRYYAYRVKESLSTRVSKFICTIFLFVFCLVGLIAFILWLSLRPHRPRFHIEDFSIPALAQPSPPPAGALINFNVTIRNSNQKVIVHYDSIECGVYYRDQPVGGAPLVTESFDQESKNTTIIMNPGAATLTGVTGQLWSDMQHDRTTVGSVVFRLEITSAIKFEIFSWDTKRHKMHANCPAVIGSDGSLVPGNMGKRCPVYFS